MGTLYYADYNALSQEKDGSAAASQIHAFEDTWHWDIETRKAYDTVAGQPRPLHPA